MSHCLSGHLHYCRMSVCISPPFYYPFAGQTEKVVRIGVRDLGGHHFLAAFIPRSLDRLWPP